MKRKILPLLVAGLTTGYAGLAAAGDVTVYGKINASLQAIEEERLGDTTQDNWEMLSNASRLGVKGSLDITDTLKAIYKLEYELIVDEDKAGDGGSNFKQRNTYGGLQGNFGTVIFGRNDTPTKLAQGDVDRFNDLLDGDIKYVMAGEQRENNIVIYSTPKLADAIAVNVAFMPGEDDGTGSDDDDGFADYFSASVTYDTDMLYLALATDQDVDNNDLYRLVGEFRADNFKIGAIYQMSEETDSDQGGIGGLSGLPAAVSSIDAIEDQDAYLISAEFTVISNLTLKAQYGYSESSHVNIDSDTEITQAVVGADYKLADNTKVFAYYAMVDADNSDIDGDNDDNTFGVGCEIKF